MILQIRNHIGEHYRISLVWLGIALVVVASVSVFTTISKFITGSPTGIPVMTYGVMVLSGILVFCAGYAFSQTADEAAPASGFDAIFGGTVQIASITSPLDLVTQTARFVSPPAAIDTLLDPVRSISSLLEPGQKISERDEGTLTKVYLQLEDYLTTKEPLRTFTKEELRKVIDPALRQKLETLTKTSPSH